MGGLCLGGRSSGVGILQEDSRERVDEGETGGSGAWAFQPITPMCAVFPGYVIRLAP